MVISNYVLWPLANSLNAHSVPAEHRKIAGHIITVRKTSSACGFSSVLASQAVVVCCSCSPWPWACRLYGMRGCRQC